MKLRIDLIIIVAVLLRVAISAVTFHPDIQALDMGNFVVSQGNLVNLYDFLYSLPKDHFILQHYPVYLFNYPPAIYFFFGFFGLIFNNLISNQTYQDFLFNFPSTIGNPGLYVHLIFLKFPYILFDLSIAVLLKKLLEGKPSQKLIFYFWLFNPVNLYSTYMMGQFDIIPVFFVVLSLFMVRAENPPFKSGLLSAVYLGLGASFKIFPYLFVVPLMSVFTRWRDRLVIFATALAAYAATTLPFIGSRGYRTTALVASQTLKSFYAQIPVSGGESLLVFVVALVFLFALFLNQLKKLHVWQKYFFTIILFFVFTHTHPQWFLWITPFLILELVYRKGENFSLILVLFLGFLGQIFFFDPTLSIGLFSPLNRQLVNTPGIWQMLNINIDYNFARSLIQSVSAGIMLFLIFMGAKKSSVYERSNTTNL